MADSSAASPVVTESGVVWAVQAGYEGTWRTLPSRFSEREEAMHQLDWARTHAPRSVLHRLIRETTTVTREVEDA